MVDAHTIHHQLHYITLELSSMVGDDLHRGAKPYANAIENEINN